MQELDYAKMLGQESNSVLKKKKISNYNHRSISSRKGWKNLNSAKISHKQLPCHSTMAKKPTCYSTHEHNSFQAIGWMSCSIWIWLNISITVKNALNITALPLLLHMGATIMHLFFKRMNKTCCLLKWHRDRLSQALKWKDDQIRKMNITLMVY